MVDGDAEIDACERVIERSALRLIALRQPRAQDLRMTVSAMKIAHSLERTGDIAKSMAKRVRRFEGAPANAGLTALVADLGRRVSAQHAKVLDAYESGDPGPAMEVWNADAEVDAQADRLFRAVLDLSLIHI